MASRKKKQGRRLKTTGFKIMKPPGMRSAARPTRPKPAKGGCTNC